MLIIGMLVDLVYNMGLTSDGAVIYDTFSHWALSNGTIAGISALSPNASKLTKDTRDLSIFTWLGKKM